MLVDQLGRLARRVQQDREGVEAAHVAAQLDAAEQIDRHADIFFADLVEKRVLQVQLRFVHFLRCPFVIVVEMIYGFLPPIAPASCLPLPATGCACRPGTRSAAAGRSGAFPA